MNSLKKIISVILCISMLMLSLCAVSCTSEGGETKDTNADTNGNTNETVAEKKNPTCQALAEAIVAKYSDIPNQGALYLAGADEDSDNWFDPDYAGLLYTGDYDTPAGWDTLTDYAVRLPEGKSAFEIHVFKTTDSEAAQTLLANRIAQIEASDIKLYDTEGYAKIFGNAEVKVVEDYVFLLITSDNALANEAINSLMY